MVDYPDLSSLNNGSGVAGLMALPNSSYPYYWAWILGGIWTIIVLTLYFKEYEKLGKARILSSMSVACLAVLLLATIGSVFTIISVEILVVTLVLSFLIIGIWFFAGK